MTFVKLFINSIEETVYESDLTKEIIFNHLHMGTIKHGSRKKDRTDMLNEGVIKLIDLFISNPKPIPAINAEIVNE